MSGGIFAVKECECDVEHSITKLGHCGTCPHQGTESDNPPPFPTTRASGCGPTKHLDGTPHNFDWATYADERMATGVCSCGLSAMTESLWEWP